MNDTPDYILKKQFEICYARPESVKLAGLFDLTELSRAIIKDRIKEKNPGISEIDLHIELFKTFYRFDFSPEQMEKIIESMKAYFYKLTLIHPNCLTPARSQTA